MGFTAHSGQPQSSQNTKLLTMIVRYNSVNKNSLLWKFDLHVGIKHLFALAQLGCKQNGYLGNELISNNFPLSIGKNLCFMK